MNFSKKNKAGSSAAGDCNKCQKIEKKLEEAKKRLKKKLAKLNSLKKLAAKKLAKKVATLPLKAVPILGWAMAAYDVYDLVTTGIDVSDLVEAFNKEADIMNKLHEKFEECLGEKDPPGTKRDANGKLRNEDGTFAKDPNKVDFQRSKSERKKTLLRDAKDPDSGLSDRARKEILDSNGNKVPRGYEVSHEKPLYTGKTASEKEALDRASNMKTQQKAVHRKRHQKCGDQYHDFPF